MIPIFWSLPTGFLTGSAAAAGIGAIAAIGNLGGFGGPAFTGAMEDSTGDFVTPFLVLAGAAGGGLPAHPAACASRPWPRRRSRGRRRSRRACGLAGLHNQRLWRGQPKAAVVGAGPAGLTALVALTRAGIDATCFEKGDRPGGLWAYGAPLSGAYRSLHLNTSKARTELAGFPMPADWPDFPSHERIGEYFGRYVDEKGVRDRIRFEAAVTRAERRPGGGWSVQRRGRLRGRVRRAGGGQRPQLGAAPARPALSGHASTAPRSTPTTTASPTCWTGAGCWWWGWATPRWTSPWSPRRWPSARSCPPGAARGSCPSTCSASRPTRSPRPRWRGFTGGCASRSRTRCCARRSAGPRPTGCPPPEARLPAQPPHDLRRRAVAPHPRRDPAQAGGRVARRRRRDVHRRHARGGGHDRVVHRLPGDRAVPGRVGAGRPAGRPVPVQADVPPRARRRLLHRAGADHRLGHPGGGAPVRAAGRPPHRPYALPGEDAPARRRQAPQRAAAKRYGEHGRPHLRVEFDGFMRELETEHRRGRRRAERNGTHA